MKTYSIFVGLMALTVVCGCTLQKPISTDETITNDESLQIANPASVYCNENGGTLEIRTGDDGGQYGVCIFSNGTECEEWAFYRGECASDNATSIGFASQCPLTKVAKFESETLGIKLDYEEGQNVIENDDILEFDHNRIEFFDKGKNETLEEAISRLFLKDAEKNEACEVVTKEIVNSTVAEIIPKEDWLKSKRDADEELTPDIEFGWGVCGGYGKTNGLQYFLSQKEGNPEKFIFVRVGQACPPFNEDSIQLF